MIYYTADTHFGHQNIMKFCNRPFENTDAMDEEIIRRWNARVKPEDDVYHLGDFAFKNGKHAESYLSRLNGRKHLIWGNHDPSNVRESKLWATSQHYLEIKDDGRNVVLFHYPIREWNRSYHGSYHLFGHVHGGLPPLGRSTDAGVDCWEYEPKTLDEMITKMPEAK